MPPRPQLEQAGHRVRDAFDQSQRERPGGQHRCQQYRNKRDDDIGGKVVEETDEPENHDRAGKLPADRGILNRTRRWFIHASILA
jgi:hypothetical protein